MAGQAHNCVGGPGGHLGSFEHSAVLGPASKCGFWLKFMFIVPHLGFLGLVLELCLDGFVQQGEFYSRDSLTEMDKAEASSGGQEHRLSAPIQEPAWIFKTPPGTEMPSSYAVGRTDADSPGG